MIIYKVTNKINGKCYIGQTKEHRLIIRKASHHYRSKFSDFAFHKALRFYGKDNFKWEILEECKNSYDLDLAEEWYIRLYNSQYPNGYNHTKGGLGCYNPMFDKNIKKKQRKSLLKVMKKYIGDNNVMKRPEVKKKHKKNILESMKRPEVIEKNKIRNERQRKSYLVITPNREKIIIKGLNRFCETNNLNQGHMSSVASGKRKSHKGFKCTKIKEN